MAANDYYGSYNVGRREDAPLPPVPAGSPSPVPSPHPMRPQIDTQNLQQYDNSYPSAHSVHSHPSAHTHQAGHSPVVGSPFTDNAYPAYPQNSHPAPPNPYGPVHGDDDTSYHGAGVYGQQRPMNSDPFIDGNAIPMQPKADASPSRYNADPEGRAPLVGGPDGMRRSHSRRHKKKNGWFTGKIPWVVYTLTVVQIAVFIGEIIKNATLTGSPIMVKPYFNPMIGPSPYVYIAMGARYVPCMRQMGGDNEVNITSDVGFMCPNTTTADSGTCSLATACGMSGIPDADSDGTLHPNQWYRFITPIFLHGGLIHIIFNMLVQLTVGRDMEQLIGSIRFFLVYFAAGIFGNVLGGNYAPNGMASTGASGSIFGLIALTLLDLLYHWKERVSPWKELLFIALDVVIAFVLGLLPGLDNFAHIGGFIMGLGLGIAILHSPQALRERIGVDDPPYSAVPNPNKQGQGEGFETMKAFTKQPVGFFKGRKPLWWAWWLVRVGCVVAVIVIFIVLLNNFYIYHKSCNWCKHLSCLPVKDWCDQGTIELKTTKRDLFGLDNFSPADVGAMPMS